MAANIQGGAWAPNGVYSEILSGMNAVSSVGCSVTYYTTLQSDWIYGAVDYYTVTNPYQTSLWNSNGRM